jgi:predicted nucleic acid-binding protein
MLNDQHAKKAQKLIERIDHGNDMVLISRLVILEVLEVIRKRITERENYVGLSESVKQQIKRKVDAKTIQFIDKVTKLAGQGKAQIVDPDTSIRQYFESALKVFQPYFGDISHLSYCFKCKRNTPPSYRYRGFGHYDVEHATNARDCSAYEMFSFDKGVAQLQAIPEFSSVKITVL